MKYLVLFSLLVVGCGGGTEPERPDVPVATPVWKETSRYVVDIIKITAGDASKGYCHRTAGRPLCVVEKLGDSWKDGYQERLTCKGEWTCDTGCGSSKKSWTAGCVDAWSVTVDTDGFLLSSKDDSCGTLENYRKGVSDQVWKIGGSYLFFEGNLGVASVPYEVYHTGNNVEE